MKRRQWTSQDKFRIVLQALRGQKDIKKLCDEHSISQAQFYKWRERLLRCGYQVFEARKMNEKGERLREENRRLRHLLSELAVKLEEINMIDLHTEEISVIEESVQAEQDL